MKLSPLSTLLCAAPALAGTANFDAHPEGIIGTTFIEGGITFSNLDNTLQPIGTAFFIAEQADGSLTGQTGFSTPICLGSVGWAPGPGASFGRTKSYEMTTGAQSDHVSIELFEFGSYAGNTVTLEAWLGTQLVGSDVAMLVGGYSITHHQLVVDGPAFDRVRVVGNGPTDSGVFFGLTDDVTITTNPFDSECFGDGTLAACPCSNSGQTGNGCDNSAGTGGALLSATGNVSPDSVVLHAIDELPSSLSIFLQGTTILSPLLFGDGLRCVGGLLKRLAVRNASGCSVTYPLAGDLSISARSAQLGDTITSGSLRYYQTYYRDPLVSFCPSGGTYNITNAITVHW